MRTAWFPRGTFHQSPFVRPLGLEPRTPTLKVSYSTNWVMSAALLNAFTFVVIKCWHRDSNSNELSFFQTVLRITEEHLPPHPVDVISWRGYANSPSYQHLILTLAKLVITFVITKSFSSFFVGPVGLEPTTSWLWVNCSNRLSYEPFNKTLKCNLIFWNTG